jgi:hypothetical protein
VTKQYASANAFRRALEERLKNLSRKQDIDIQRLRRQVAFDRLLCRLFKTHPKNLFLKGGYSMELRMHMARTTKDIDLILRAKTLKKIEAQDQEILDLLQQSAREDLGDFFVFLVGTPTLDLEAVPYGGSRFPIEAQMDGRLFVRFPMDVVVSSMVLDPVEMLVSQDWLGFAGIEVTAFPTISKEQQFAEKLHAYTLPRGEDENSRVKDVVDMLLLIRTGNLKTDFLQTAIKEIFKYRDTHPLPDGLEESPVNWEPKFNKLAQECSLHTSLDETIPEIAHFLRLPIYANDLKMAQTISPGLCHFCHEDAVVSWVSNHDMIDTNCKACGNYRASGLFLSYNDETNNPENWHAWRVYLQNRGTDKNKRRIKISTKNFSPPK